jgi:Domain of unknown function (DUF1902)
VPVAAEGGGAGRIERDPEHVDAACEGKAAVITRPSLYSSPGGVFSGRRSERMARPVIFTISAAWDNEASVWTGHCDDIPAAADAPTLDELLAKISAMALDLLPDNHPGIAPGDLFLQITALREAEPAAA